MVSTEAPLRLHRQHQAGAHDLAVDAHRAGAANAVLAADMGPRQLQMLAQKIRQIEPRQNLRIDALAIDLERNGDMAPSSRSPRREIGTAEQRGHAARQQHLGQMPAHRSRCLLIFLRIEFFAQRRGRFGQHRRRDGDADQSCRGPGQYRPIADGKEGQPKIGEAALLHDRLRRQTDDGVVAVPPGEFMEEMRGVFSGNRQFDRDQQFLCRQARSRKSR